MAFLSVEAFITSVLGALGLVAAILTWWETRRNRPRSKLMLSIFILLYQVSLANLCLCSQVVDPESNLFDELLLRYPHVIARPPAAYISNGDSPSTVDRRETGIGRVETILESSAGTDQRSMIQDGQSNSRVSSDELNAA
jgi:hypothetical protein